MQSDITTKPEYLYIIKCVLMGHKSTSSIHKIYIKQFGKITVNQISNMLSPLSQKYKFLARKKKGRHSNYYVNLPYWYEFINTHFFRSNTIKQMDYKNEKLISLLKNYIKNNLDKPIPLLNFLHYFICQTAIKPIETEPKIIKNLSFETIEEEIKKGKPMSENEIQFYSFKTACRSYLENRLYNLSLPEINFILGKEKKIKW